MRIVIVFCMSIFGIGACTKNKVSTSNEVQIEKENISFTGKWQRQFEAGPGNPHTAEYVIYQDSMRYTLSGSLGMSDYLLTRDTFLLENNRFIGHTNGNRYYLIFVKNILGDSLRLYKQEVSSVAEGMAVGLPSDSTSANYGWGVYYKK